MALIHWKKQIANHLLFVQFARENFTGRSFPNASYFSCNQTGKDPLDWHKEMLHVYSEKSDFEIERKWTERFLAMQTIHSSGPAQIKEAVCSSAS